MKLFLSLLTLLLLSNNYLQSQVNPDTIKTIDPYDEIVWEVKTPGQIYDVAYHPNGQSVFVLNDGVVQMYSVANGTLIKEFARGLEISLSKMAISKDGSMVAVITLAEQEQIIIFNTLTGQEVMRFRDTSSLMKPDIYNSVAFSPDGKYIVTTGTHTDSFNGYSTVLLVEILTGNFQSLNQSLYQKNNPNFPYDKFQNFTRAIFTIDGNSIITASSERYIIQKIDINMQTKIDTIIDFGNFSNLEFNIFKIDNRQVDLLICVSNANGFYNLLTKKGNTLKSKIKSYLEGFVLNKNDEKGIVANGQKLITYNLNGCLKIYEYKFGQANKLDISFNDSLIIAGDNSQNLRLLKAKWDSVSTGVPQESDLFTISTVVPNPVLNKLNINISTSLSSNIKVEIIQNTTGMILFASNYNLNQGINNIAIPTNNYVNGQYTLRASKNNFSKQLLFVINK
jgi:hypothetical protein